MGERGWAVLLSATCIRGYIGLGPFLEAEEYGHSLLRMRNCIMYD